MNNPRISGRINQTSILDVDFYHGGVLTDPYALRQIDIYHTQVLPHNLVTSILIPDFPNSPLYPAPVVRTAVGQFYLPFFVPPDLTVPDVYFDVWRYFADNPCSIIGSGGSVIQVGTDVGTGGPAGGDCDLDDPSLQNQLLSCCHRFWLYPDEWFCDDRLQSVTFGFEPLNQKFHSGDYRALEIGIMPLPLYDFDFNLVMPMVPFLTAAIHVETRNNEILVDADPMTIGLRQGSYRTNPFVLRWQLNANEFLLGTYRYRVTVQLPNGHIQTSPWFIFSIT